MKNLKVTIINAQGEAAGEASLTGQTASPLLVAQAVRAFLANQRKALAKTKTRGEVNGSKSKIYRQKGTGRARHGDRQAPIFVGGGVAHGPAGNQNFKQALNQKMTQKAILTVLAEKAKEGKVFILEADFKKTKEAAAFLAKIQESFKLPWPVAFVVDKNEEIRRALKNLEKVKVLSVENLTTYPLLKAKAVFMSKTAAQKFITKEK